MLAKAFLRGIARTVEVEDSEAIEVIETKLRKDKRKLQNTDFTVIKLMNTFKQKEE